MCKYSIEYTLNYFLKIISYFRFFSGGRDDRSEAPLYKIFVYLSIAYIAIARPHVLCHKPLAEVGRLSVSAKNVFNSLASRVIAYLRQKRCFGIYYQNRNKKDSLCAYLQIHGNIFEAVLHLKLDKSFIKRENPHKS